MTIYTLKDLNFTKAFDAISSQDPMVSTRYCLPIPNWEESGGKDDPAIQMVEGKGLRFVFYNLTDQREQFANVDGTEAIAFQTPIDVAVQLHGFIIDTFGNDPAVLCPQDVVEIIFEATRLGIHDLYDKNMSDITDPTIMHREPSIQSEFGGFGAYVPCPNMSAAIFLKGEGIYIPYEGAKPQVFNNGGYISFPALPVEELKKYSNESLVKLVADKKIGMPRMVQGSIFESNRTMPDGKLIKSGKVINTLNLESLRPSA